MGSSASSSGGLEHQGARHRHPLALAARQLADGVRDAVLEPDLDVSSRSARGRISFGDRPPIRPGIITFSSASNSGSRWWNWKMKPSASLRKRASAAGRARTRPRRGRARCPRRGSVERAQDVQQRRLADARVAHDRHALARLDHEVDAAQHLDRAVARLEEALHPLGPTSGSLITEGLHRIEPRGLARRQQGRAEREHHGDRRRPRDLPEVELGQGSVENW